MDIDVDDDLDFENDIIKKSLNANLEEIKLNNKKLEEKIKKRRQFFTNLSKSEDRIIDVNYISVSLLQKKVYNNKYIFCYELENNSEITYTQCKICVCTNDSTSFNYEVYIIGKGYSDCGENCQKINTELCQDSKISKKSFIIVVFDAPPFTDNLCYTLKGDIFLYEAERQVTVVLPDVIVSASDITKKTLTEVLIESEDTFNLLTILFCNLRTDFVMIVPKNFSNVKSIFETHCFFTSLYAENSCRKYFASVRVCSTFDNSLVAVHNLGNQKLTQVSFYTKTDNELVALLHYLYQTIAGLILIPAMCQNYDTQNIANLISIEDEIDQYKNFVKTEIGIVQRYKQYLECSRKDCDVCMSLREKLLDAEKNTDLSYLRITTDN